MERTAYPVRAPGLRTVCAWCGAVIQEGPGSGPVSHGICRACYERQVAALLGLPEPKAAIMASEEVEAACLIEYCSKFRGKPAGQIPEFLRWRGEWLENRLHRSKGSCADEVSHGTEDAVVGTQAMRGGRPEYCNR